MNKHKLNLQQYRVMQKYRIKKTLGDGTFGTVFEAISPKQQIVAIKKMKAKYKDWEECFALRQIKSLKKLDHPNIIKLKEVILANSQLFLVFDYMETNLLQVYTRAQQSGRRLTESEIKSIFYKITQGLAYLHKNGYFHRDLKPENILCHNLDVKICDFGLAREIRSRPPFTEYVSTRWYRAPELLLHSAAYNSPVDIFALAAIIVELFTMTPLFPGNNEIDTMNKIVDLLGTPRKADWPEGYKLASAMHYNFPESKGKQLYELMPNASIQVIELLQSMMCYSFRKRPSANDILKHPYFQNFDQANEKGFEEKAELKFSFYDKNIVEIPNTIKIENSKEVQMRKSLYKFGDSFSSSFHKQKKEGEKKMQERKGEERKGEERKGEERKTESLKAEDKKFDEKKKSSKNKFSEQDISAKFDEMEQILLELKKKQEMKATNPSSKKIGDRDRERENDSLKMSTFEEEQLRLRMFSLDGMAGTKSTSQMKAPIMMKNTKNY